MSEQKKKKKEKKNEDDDAETQPVINATVFMGTINGGGVEANDIT